MPRKDMPRMLPFNKKEVEATETKESAGLLGLCDAYRRLYCLRYYGETIPERFRLLSRIYGALSIYCKSDYSHVRQPKLRNLVQFLRRLSDVEEYLGHYVWTHYYISSLELYGDDKKRFNAGLTNVIDMLHSDVMKRDWGRAAQTIANIPLVSSSLYSGYFYCKYMSQLFAVYMPKLYLVTLQIYLESGASLNQLCYKYFVAMEQFVRTYVYKRKNFDNSEFYATHYVIFNLANLRLHMIDVIADFNMIKVNPEWSRTLQIYKYCAEYEKWLAERLAAVQTLTVQAGVCVRPPPSLTGMFSIVLRALLQGVSSMTSASRGTGDAGGVLPVFVQLAAELNCLDELEDALSEACLTNLVLLERAHRVLVRLNLDHVAGRLFTKATFVVPAQQLACHDFVIDIVEQRSLEPTNFGPLEDVISLNLQYLFHFLDYGRNRADERAWVLLHANCLFAAADLNAFVGALWSTRASWWRKFHNDRVRELTKRGRKKRRKVFEMLESISV